MSITGCVYCLQSLVQTLVQNEWFVGALPSKRNLMDQAILCCDLLIQEQRVKTDRAATNLRLLRG